TRNVGLMVIIEDSLTHHFVGSSADDKFVQRYAATTDFQSYALDTALVLLKQHFPKWDFCTMEGTHFLLYEESREKLRATDFRDFRESWFNTLKEDFEVDAILVVRNSTRFTDGIHWSNTDITGYGIYNGPRRTHNNVYIQLEFLFFASGRPLTHIQGPIYEREKDFPRIDSPEDLFTESDLLQTEVPLKQLIVNQVEAAISNANLLRRLR
ncbi:MAG: hypothetical protein EA361_02040, partial [Bacteroidetes bacterium]